MQRQIKYLAILLFSISLLASCAGPRSLSVDETYTAIPPAQPLPEYFRKTQERNVIITINNVADEGRNYKNYAELFINGYLIKPDHEITNLTRNYSYHMLLQPGIYNIEAKYFASTGWKVEKFSIKTREKVMVFPDKKTFLTVDLLKNSWGGLAENPTFFKIRYE
ncbi:hypothetical protein B6D60_03255 [candidate division KSB1 bacterium 4484_87]|nr:MAG: hypothetical protein B6D60_03255 [candidate division KSB1 bacterium 4484_87]